MLKTKKIRDQKGAAITGLVIALMFFVLMAGLFCFDASRVQMAQRELTATCDASALAGTAMMTSYDVSNDPTFTKLLNAQQNAGAYAYNMFMMGNVLGTWLSGNTNLVSSVNSLGTTTPGQANCCIALINTQNNFQVVPPTTPANAAGKAIGVYAGYGYHPVFISFFGVGNVGILASSIGGLPQVDTVLVLDVSGSMDDLTAVTIVSRYWDPHTGNDMAAQNSGYMGVSPDTLGYADDAQTISTWSGQSIGTIQTNFPELTGHGCVTYVESPHPTTSEALFEYVGLDTTLYLTGTSLNALPPQNLNLAQAGTFLTGSSVLEFKPYLRFPFNMSDFASPPGNCPCYKAGGGGGQQVVLFWGFGGGSGFYSPYSNPISNAVTYPSNSGVSGTAPSTGHAMIFTDMVVNLGGVIPPSYPNAGSPNLSSGTKPTQPCFGPASGLIAGETGFPGTAGPVNYQFPPQGATWNSEDDATIAGQTYQFGNVAVLVEASRGNLDLQNNLNATTIPSRGYHLLAGDPNYKAYYAVGATQMNIATGTQRAYQRLAMEYSQPIGTTLDSCDQAFFQRLSALTDCRFGLVAFSDSWAFGSPPNPNSQSSCNTGQPLGTGGTATFPGCTSFYTDVNYESALPTSLEWDGRLGTTAALCGTSLQNTQTQADQGSGQGFRLPRSPLDSNINMTQSLHIMEKGDQTNTYAWSNPTMGNGIYNSRPLNGTMCSEALATALGEFSTSPYTGSTRPGAKRAIIFFTDGVPQASEVSPSDTTASQAQQQGIAIFCIGLNMLGNPQLTTQQTSFLGNSSSGLSGIASNGGRFFMCQSVTDVQQSFSAIARRLTQSQR